MTSATPSLNKGMTLFVHAVCPYAHRSWITLLEHGAPLTHLVAVTSPGLGPTMQKTYIENINPNETVPALLIHTEATVKAKQISELKVPEDGQLLLESLDICKYFDDFVWRPTEEQALELKSFADDEHAFGGRALKKLYPEEGDSNNSRKIVDDFIKFADDEIIPTAYKLLMVAPEKQPKKAAQLTEMMREADRMLDKAPKKLDGPFLLGARLSLADIALVPFLDRFSQTLPVYYAETFDMFAEAPKLKGMLDAMRRRRSFRASAMPAEYYVKRYKYYTFKFSQGIDPRDR